MSKITVDKIRITIGRKTLELTPDELKELRDVLDATFPKQIVTVPSSPIIIKRPSYPRPWRYWEPIWVNTQTRGHATLSLTCHRESDYVKV